MDRRRFLLTSLAGAFATPRAAEAQQSGKVYRIGWLGTAPPPTPHSEAFIEGMRERGWIEGQNFVIEHRSAEGRVDGLPALVADLAQHNLDLLVTTGTPSTAAAKAAITTIPIVFSAVGDPVGSGFVASLARPGGNVTGSGGLGPGVHAKMLEILKEAVPKASRIAIFVNSALPLHTAYRAEIEPAARKLGVTLSPVEVRVAEDLDGAFATIVRARVGALLVLGQPTMFIQRARLAKLTVDHRMPTTIGFGEAAEAGVLMSYGERLIDHTRRLPHYVDRILRGAKPADLPVEQPDRFYTVINLKTAKALGLTIPPSLLLRADQVIDSGPPPLPADLAGRCPRRTARR